MKSEGIKEQYIPVVLSEEEVENLIDCLYNDRQKYLITTAYLAGLRVRELVNLKINDIDAKEMVIRIQRGDGFKERNIVLSGKLLEIIREYYKKYCNYSPTTKVGH